MLVKYYGLYVQYNDIILIIPLLVSGFFFPSLFYSFEKGCKYYQGEAFKLV